MERYEFIAYNLWYNFISETMQLNATNTQINLGIMDENKNSKVHTIKII